MTVYITAISPQEVDDHERITEVWWLNATDSTSNVMSVSQAVEFLRRGGQLLVAGHDRAAAVQVVEHNPPYIRTVADGAWSDNLMALPRF